MAGWRNRVSGTALAVMLALTMAGALAVPGTAGAEERRVALVIGNGAYEKVPKLANPASDAQAMSGMSTTRNTSVPTRCSRRSPRANCR